MELNMKAKAGTVYAESTVMMGKEAVESLVTQISEASIGIISLRMTELTNEIYCGEKPSENDVILFTAPDNTVSVDPARIAKSVIAQVASEFRDKSVDTPFKMITRVVELCKLMKAEKMGLN